MAAKINVKPLTGLLVVVALLFVVAGVIYMTKTAANLPAFFPGHVKAGGSGAAHKHTKHGLAMFGLAAVSLVGAWFSTAPERT
ncbi:MAG: hypothetical protein JWN46_2432 [Acidimicrobiales bacterium]|nr:hypothetical protein [Acidimicrobiales bacterium]